MNLEYSCFDCFFFQEFEKRLSRWETERESFLQNFPNEELPEELREPPELECYEDMCEEGHQCSKN